MRRRDFLALAGLCPQVRQAPFKILEWTRMRAVLVESFNLLSPEQVDEFRDSGPQRRLMASLAEGFAVYRSSNELSDVIVTLGHGIYSPGAVNTAFEGKEVNERLYTLGLARHLSLELQSRDFTVHTLRYEQPEGPLLRETKAQRLRRLDAYARQANELARNRIEDFALVDLHVDAAIAKQRTSKGIRYLRLTDPRPPHFYVWPGSQQSRQLAMTLQRQFSAYCK